MSWPLVSRHALVAVEGERDYLRVELARLAEENRALTNAMLTNARLVPVFDARPGVKTHAWAPRRKTVVGVVQELERKTAEKADVS